MANEFNPLARSAFARGEIDWLSDDFRVTVLDSSYLKDPSDEFLADLSSGIIATSSLLTGKTVAAGWCKASNVTLPGVASGDTITQLWVFQDTGIPGTSRLVAYFDRDAAATMISYETNDGDISLLWNSLGIFRV